MHDLIEREAVGGILLQVGMLDQIGASTSNSSVAICKSSAEMTLPPVPGRAPTSDTVPTLPQPRSFDAMELASKFLSLKMKIQDTQAAASMEDVRHRSELQKQQNEKIARKIADAAEKLKEAKKSSRAARIFGWIATALFTVAAVLTGGAFAIGAAVVAVAVATLSETGVLDKMMQAIARSLIKDQGMAEDQAKVVATFITQSIILACLLVTSVAAVSAATIGPLAAAALAAEGVALVAKSAAQIASGVLQKQATDAQAETLDIRILLARLAQLSEDDIGHIRELVLGMKTATRNVVEAIEEQSRCLSTVVRNIG
ncbi:type III secretion system translocon subunit SctE [Rhizobium etli]|uniref:Translocator protein BipB-like C-terminal domain-containing protein n=1 Tax=Rhizobium etli TaxID=29449 RepID=A0A7W6VHN0_RHIET|nr:type III secretion system translocon subunit SctE [Rhizobium etli]MBB4483484.1 hypothetical protein [Rhizobium etli]MBB4539295.1 hypothetical protein [Rhizobium etli]